MDRIVRWGAKAGGRCLEAVPLVGGSVRPKLELHLRPKRPGARRFQSCLRTCPPTQKLFGDLLVRLFFFRDSTTFARKEGLFGGVAR